MPRRAAMAAFRSRYIFWPLVARPIFSLTTQYGAKMDLTEVSKMAYNDNAEHVRILSSVREGIEMVHRRMQELQPELSTSSSEVLNAARQELCASLVRRLVIAEKEVQELQDMLKLNQKA
jgi:hypothetical protein